ncbi:hypothetical protein LINPERHAP2_LOCUS21241 [Linum perenne]
MSRITKSVGCSRLLEIPSLRLLVQREYQSFRIGSDGNLQGLGVFINLESKIGHLMGDYLDVAIM